MPQFLAKAAILATYGKTLAVIVQVQPIEYINQRSDRITVEEEPHSHLANVIFFRYRLAYDPRQDIHPWQPERQMATSSRRLETAFIAGLLGQVP